MINKTKVSTHAHRVDKMSGIRDKTNWTSIGKAVIKKIGNAKRRRLLKNNLKL